MFGSSVVDKCVVVLWILVHNSTVVENYYMVVFIVGTFILCWYLCVVVLCGEPMNPCTESGQEPGE